MLGEMIWVFGVEMCTGYSENVKNQNKEHYNGGDWILLSIYTI